jgi:hypothetical protein
MRERTAKAFMEAAEEMSLAADLQPRYSGRGMYGKETCAIVCGPHVFLLLVAVASARVHESESPSNDNEWDDLVEEIGNLRQDSMGRSDIVVY